MDSLCQRDTNERLYQLHNHYALKIGPYMMRLYELEEYAWDDPFTHRNEKQKDLVSNNGSICGFYIHRTGSLKSSAYKGHTYKGIDIVLGIGSSNTYISILIRAIHVAKIGIEQGSKTHLVFDPAVIEGPCKIVDHICSISGLNLSQLETQLQLVPCDWSRKCNPIYGSRVGLTLKRAGKIPKSNTGIKEVLPIERWAQYLIMPLRSATYYPSKDKDSFFVCDINRKDIPSHSMERIKLEYENGKSMSLSNDMTPLQVAGYFSKV